MKISIIGAAGFLGHSLINYLSNKKDIKLKLIDTKNRIKILKKKENINQHEINHVDYNNEKSIKESLKNTDILINFFTLTDPQTSMRDNYLKSLKEIEINLLIFKYSNFFKIKKIIFISSGGAIYGKANKFPINEEYIPNPISSYGISKLCSEKYLSLYKNIDYVSLRISNAYGPLQFKNTKIGFISNAIDKIINNKVINIWGNLDIIKDYIYIDDICKAIEKIIYTKKFKSNLYNLSNSKGISIKKILKILEISLNKKSKIKYYQLRNFDIDKNILSNKKFLKDYDWQPNTSINEGIKKMIDYYKFHF